MYLMDWIIIIGNFFKIVCIEEKRDESKITHNEATSKIPIWNNIPSISLEKTWWSRDYLEQRV